MRGALGVISDEMADAFTFAGTPQQVQKRITAYRAAGVNSVVLNPSPPDVYFPLFQGQFPEGAEVPPFSFPEYLQVIQDVIDFRSGAAAAR
jgi:alkanesulfonate monooxygenase SsuD/methylene tetrahydromethanopterin reductase-like flavin-dependent oxidoreductase (luciferase family)